MTEENFVNRREVYAQKALCQVPRLLGNMDRNPFSPTYGCMHRDYWLDKTSDFPDAVRQFGVHALALVYRHDFPGSVYQGQSKIRDWAVAGLEFWARIQHRDGSFDEFYPFERGWVGPTAFTTYTAVESFELLRAEISEQKAQVIRAAIRRAAQCVACGDSEEDHLANHHAMACLALWKAYQVLQEPELKEAYHRLWQGFLNYHHRDEGWSIEYDGIDPGYLSATVSFLAKIYQVNPDPAIREVLSQSVEMCSYFVYPNGFYAGSIGSRNTLHFYPHGFEILGNEVPMAKPVAEKMLHALSENKLVPPEIISDRYLAYRVPEFLLAYLDHTDRTTGLPLQPLPYERAPFMVHFPKAGIYVRNDEQIYTIANLAKAGVTKIFDKQKGELLFNDCGWIGASDENEVFTSQWIDPDFKVETMDNGWSVSGPCHRVPANKVFTLPKNLAFRLVLLLLGWSPSFAHLLKGRIRKALTLGKRPVPIRFKRTLTFSAGSVQVDDEIAIDERLTVAELSCGDEFFVRYVPQSRYFQLQELDVQGRRIAPQQIKDLNREKKLVINRTIRIIS